jgi:hypothetical protein
MAPPTSPPHLATNPVRGEVVDFPAGRIIWARPANRAVAIAHGGFIRTFADLPALQAHFFPLEPGRPAFRLEGDQMAVTHAGSTIIYSNPEAFEAAIMSRRGALDAEAREAGRRRRAPAFRRAWSFAVLVGLIVLVISR